MNDLANINSFSLSIITLLGVMLVKFIVYKLSPHEPLSFFRFFCQQLSNKVNKEKNSDQQRVIAGGIAVLVTLSPLLIILWLFAAFIEATWLWQCFLLYFAIAPLNVADISKNVANFISTNNNGQAKKHLADWVGRETKNLSTVGLSKAVIEMHLLRTIQSTITIGLIFIAFDALTALAVRLLLEMHYCWNVKYIKHYHFGRSVAFLYKLIQWIPSRLFGFLLLISTLGQNFSVCFTYSQKHFWSLNNNYPLAILAFAQSIKLGGVAMYSGIKLRRISFNEYGHQPKERDVISSSKRIQTVLYFTFLCIAMLAVLSHAINV